MSSRRALSATLSNPRIPQLMAAFALAACSSSVGNEAGSGGTAVGNHGGATAGGAASSAGASATGGTVTLQGGSTNAAGGATGSGNGGTSVAGAASGGASANAGAANGGASNAGATSSSGGRANGGSAGSISSATGGAKSSGGATGNGGSKSSGGASASGGASSGGSKSSGGASASGGASSGGSTGSPGGTFSQCRFHFGTIDSKATAGGSALISQLDFFTPGWMQGESFDQSNVCNEAKAGAALGNQVPVVVAYISAAYVKRHYGICDCNVTTCGANNDLCHQGAALISQNLTTIVNAYKSYSQGYAGCYGTTRPIIFEMEPDFYQYTISSQSQPWTQAQAGQYMSQLVSALKSSLPNARFSIDVSPWVGPSNGGDNGAAWYANFDMSLFTFVNTSGGGTNANTTRIRSSNAMTWAGLSQVTGKPILADTGYGANGVSAGEDPNWNVAANINARIADGVVSISQYNPSSSWATTISGVRSQLSTPKFCP